MERSIDARRVVFDGLESKLEEILEMLAKHQAELERERQQIEQMIRAVR